MILKAGISQTNNLNVLIQQSIDILESGVVFPKSQLTPKQERADNLSEVKKKSLEHIKREIYICQKCNLYKSRRQAVSGMGSRHPLLMVVGEAPGAREDEQGIPFVGESGKYLDKWLESIGLSRNKNVYITNTVKCRPPHNRDPKEDEVFACSNYLIAQIEILKPKLILAVGRIAGNILTKKIDTQLSVLRTQVFEFQEIPLFVTYHPSAVLRNPHELKQFVWEDLQKIQNKIKELGIQ